MISAPFVGVWSHGICKITKNTPLTRFDSLPFENASGFIWLFSVSVSDAMGSHHKAVQGLHVQNMSKFWQPERPGKKKKSSGDKHSKGSGKEGQWEEGLWLADAEGPGMDATFQRENDGKSLHLQREHEP